LVGELLGVKLAKGLTFTDWSRRPLSKSQLRYAADDVRYLLAVHDELVKRLSTLGHVDLARRACESLDDQGLYQFDPATAYQRVRGAGSLDRKQLATLRELTIWRDAGARKIDLPPRMYIKDEVLVAIVRDKPADERALAKIKGMPRPVATEQFDAI